MPSELISSRATLHWLQCSVCICVISGTLPNFIRATYSSNICLRVDPVSVLGAVAKNFRNVWASLGATVVADVPPESRL